MTSNLLSIFEKRFDLIIFTFLLLLNLFFRYFITWGLISEAETEEALHFRAVSAWMPEPEPMSKTLLFFT